MGILNVTPDSFSVGPVDSVDRAVAHCMGMMSRELISSILAENPAAGRQTS